VRAPFARRPPCGAARRETIGTKNGRHAAAVECGGRVAGSDSCRRRRGSSTRCAAKRKRRCARRSRGPATRVQLAR
jgi:hypothetical protein